MAEVELKLRLEDNKVPRTVAPLNFILIVVVIVALWQQPVLMCHTPFPLNHYTLQPPFSTILAAVLGEATWTLTKQRQRQRINTFMVCNRLA